MPTRQQPAASQRIIPSTFSDPPSDLPKILVFDLDYTLWPFWCDTHCSPPLKPLTGAQAGTAVKDKHGEHFGFYSHVPSILASARERGFKIAAASRTGKPPVADQLLRLLHIESKPAKEYFDNLQIYPGDKVKHLTLINQALGENALEMKLSGESATREKTKEEEENEKRKLEEDYANILFFDDEKRNNNVEKKLGVAFWQVPDGVTAEEIDAGIRYWRTRREERKKKTKPTASSSSGETKTL